MSDVSLIGLGAMGSALANTLLQNGYAVTVWNRSGDRAAALVEAGAAQAQTAAEALAASPATIVCIATHEATHALLQENAAALRGRTIIELSTGGSEEAERLAAMLESNGAEWLIGIINAYPSMIGDANTVLSIVGDAGVWRRWEKVIRTLGGASAHFGTEASMAAVLFAALFTTRQGFMWGMLYGAMVCRQAGIPLDVFSAQVPVSLGMLPDYHRYFAATAPAGNFDNPQASMNTYAAALDDALGTFESCGAPDELPRLFSQLAQRGVDAGLGDKALTALIDLLPKK